MKKITRLFSVVLSINITTIDVIAQDVPIYDSQAIFHPVISKNGMVASQEDLATQAGLEVLKEGGNAIDAAVTVGFTLAVTLPRAGNLGGGGFMLIHLTKQQQTIALDYREKAPLAATENMFLDENSNVDQKKVRFSHQAVGVPGTVAGLAMALEKYGTISLKRALEPAIKLAENGIIVDEDLYNSLIFSRRNLQKNPASLAIFYKSDGSPYQIGENLKQTDLANSLKLIAKQGIKAFYQGDIADKIVADMEANNGLITKEDLAKYQPIIREPIVGNYRGYQVYSMPPPSSGGVHLVQILNILENFPIQSLGQNTASTLHLMVEAMKFAYSDRFKFMGDWDVINIPIPRLISKNYGNSLSKKINLQRATPSQNILPHPIFQSNESKETTHYSVMDRYGNAVANTYTLNFSYGTGIMAKGTGILLNNEMDDFAAKPGVPNASQLIGSEGNKIAPEKRMLSSMTPTIVMKEGKPWLVTGSPGASRIITTTLQIIMNVIDHKMNIAEATNAPRIHHQWYPDQVQVERGINKDTIELLEKKGHKIIKSSFAMGSTQSIMYEKGRFYGASDTRQPGALTLGY
ncbi:gamma-glutamyltransferase [Aphanothece sacrum]|uniref:Glutathione hydrolase proenzyme n=1 Tax=Aphanothece sacrum FPU1 TaxID=1920663 RepID=A0A401IDL1_APHSA|nr:gamma-glutamyltransferase [Aphanothece sacrum]GBF79377.1 gamma-glutamyltranspeptidase [Aphanothece sacrum FPU1]GBF86878.1 gamma-glutamyltranspeptidase [Aphanothece sacrum FPU3]